MAEVFSALVTLASVVKQVVENTTINVTISAALRDRVELVIRVLQKYPNPKELDEVLMGKLFKLLMETHDFLVSYKTMSQMSRVLKATSIRQKIESLDNSIGKCLDDLVLCIGVAAANRLESIRLDLSAGPSAGASKEEEIISAASVTHLIDYSDLNFDAVPGTSSNEIASGIFSQILRASLRISSIDSSSRAVGTTVAIKFPNQLIVCTDEEWVALCSNLTSLTVCPHLCKILGCGIQPRRFMVMEYIEGMTLFDRVMAESLPMGNDPIFSLKTAFGIAAGLSFLHSFASPIIHGNMSPFHVVIDSSLSPKIIDYGLRIWPNFGDIGGGSTSKQVFMDIDSLPLQNIVWLAPEQAKGTGSASCASDIYSFALIVSFLIGGSLPYNFNSVSSTGRFNLVELLRSGRKPAIVNSPHPRLLPFMSTMFNMCLNPSLADRPSAVDVVKMLRSGCHDLSVDLREVGVDYPVTPCSSAAYHESCDPGQDETMSLMSGFDEATSQIENVGSALTLFRLTSGPTDTKFIGKETFIAVYGSKVIVSSLQVSNPPTAPSISYDQEGDIGTDALDVVNQTEFQGTVIFHIDSTKSMGKFNRMSLTLQVLHRIIPKLVRQGFRILVNAWSVSGSEMIRTRVVNINPELLSTEKSSDLENYLNGTVFDIFRVPDGQTDLYGAVFGLFQQCNEYLRLGPVHSFLLTDGNHNVLTKPKHSPRYVGDSYFGMVIGALNSKGNLVWVANPKAKTPLPPATANEFLRGMMLSLTQNSSIIGDVVNEDFYPLSLTLVGIGDADSDRLATFAADLGPQVSYYGVTEVNHSDMVFTNVTGANTSVTITFDKSNSISLSYVVEDNCSIDGSVNIDNPAVLQQMVQSKEVSITYGKLIFSFAVDSTASVPVPSRSSIPPDEVVGEFVTALQCIRWQPYVVSGGTVSEVFRNLILDKKKLQSVKGSFYTRNLRKLRQQWSLLDGLTIWIRELEDLISNQIESYRMNVESEILVGLTCESNPQTATVQLSEAAMGRLQNNMIMAGRSIHRVNRHIAAISSIRDKTILITSKLMQSNLSLKRIVDGITLEITFPAASNTKELSWCVTSEASTLKKLMDSVLCKPVEAESGWSVGMKFEKKLAMLNPIEIPVTFPCILLKARFDCYSIIRAPYSFSVEHIITDAVGSTKAAVFCAEELWELNLSAHRVAGDPIILGYKSLGLGISSRRRLVEEMSDEDVLSNMILPLAFSPLLFSLYSQRGRCFVSGLNVTGDAMALTPVSLQWGKFFCDALLCLQSDQIDIGHKLLWCECGLKAIVSFSFAMTERVAAWATGIEYVAKLFPVENNLHNAAIESARSPIPEVLTRENITTHLAVAALVACEDEWFAQQPGSWNLVARTMFSRMSESISGTKIVRRPDLPTDLGSLEEAYRLHIGALQTLLQRRLHVEWANSSLEQKLAIVSSNANSIYNALCAIVDDFFSKFDQFYLETWTQCVFLLSSALTLRQYSIKKLKSQFECLEEPNGLIDSLSNCSSKCCGIRVVEHNVSTGHLEMRPLTDTDYYEMVGYIDAIVATKISPKVVYAKFLNPSFPTVDIGVNRQLQFLERLSEWNESLPIANVTFIGNVNSGKSSLSGFILATLGIIDQQIVDRLGQQAEKIGQSGNLKYAWLMDRTSEERGSGHTIHPVWSGFQSNSRRFTIIDNPGHKDFTMNATHGIFHADVAILVTSSVMSEIEFAELSSGQAMDHLLTAFCFGVRQLVVAVNKMDLIDYSKTEFDRVRLHTLKLLKKIGFRDSSCIFVPISVMGSDGIFECSSRMSWYDGPCLLQAMEGISLPMRQVDQPTKLVVSEVFKSKSGRTIICGKVERGAIAIGESVSIHPSGERCLEAKVKSMQTVAHISLQCAKAGDDVGIELENLAFGRIGRGSNPQRTDHPQSKGKLKKKPSTTSVVPANVRRGMVMTLSSQMQNVVMTRFEAQIFVVGGHPLRVGQCPTLSIHLDVVSVRIFAIKEIINAKNEVIDMHPESVSIGQIGICELVANRPIAAETCHTVPRLSRFVIKCNRVVAAVGFIRAILG